jgi:hypothetical protein
MLVVATTTALACRSGSRPATGAAVRDTLPDGTLVVRYGSLADAPPSRLDLDLTIGVPEGDPNLIFGDVRAVDAAADGTIYVLDFQAAEVRAFDANGRFLRVVASSGEGPGEIGAANGLVLVGDSVLWIQDHGNWRMMAVTPDGDEVAAAPMHVRAYGYVWDGTIDRDGVFWKPMSHSDSPRRPYPPEEGLLEERGRAYLKSYDPRTEIMDSVFVAEVAFRAVVSRNDRGGYSYRGIPHDPRVLTVVDPAGGFWQASGTAYGIARLDATGDTTMLVEVDAEPVPVTQEEKARYVEEVVARSPSDRRAAEEVAALVPAFKPAIAELMVDDEDRLWARRAGAEESPPVWDIFRRTGEYEGSVAFSFQPAPYLPIRVRRGRVYGVIRDSLDIPAVFRSGPIPLSKP